MLTGLCAQPGQCAPSGLPNQLRPSCCLALCTPWGGIPVGMQVAGANVPRTGRFALLDRLPASTSHLFHNLTPVSQIAEAKEFMKRRFVTKLASRNIAYKV